jgi:hypothetical protein
MIRNSQEQDINFVASFFASSLLNFGIYREHSVEQGDSELLEMHVVEEIESKAG